MTSIVSLEEAIVRRRSARDFLAAPLTVAELSQLLWAVQGITEPARQLRSAPSAGATYPLATYVATAEGVFLYRPPQHDLRRLQAQDVRADLSRAALNQRWVKTAAAVIILAMTPERTTRRYGERGLRYIYMEAGHAAQNMHLQAVALGLGSVPVGAFDDAAVARIVDLPADQQALYLIPVGKIESSP